MNPETENSYHSSCFIRWVGMGVKLQLNLNKPLIQFIVLIKKLGKTPDVGR